MAQMCTLKGCSDKKGSCKHEKAMVLLMVFLGIGWALNFAFMHWF